jgi:hypothetical protein
LFRRDWRSLALRCLDALVRCEARDDLTPYVDALASLRDACEQEIRDVSAPPEEGFYAGAAAGQGGADRLTCVAGFYLPNEPGGRTPLHPPGPVPESP